MLTHHTAFEAGLEAALVYLPSGGVAGIRLLYPFQGTMRLADAPNSPLVAYAKYITCAHLDSNQNPRNYEFPAPPIEL